MPHFLMPWTGFGNVNDEKDSLLGRRVATGWNDFPTLGEWCPAMDISETTDRLVVKVEVPGMDEKDIRISLQEHLLTITGEKRRETEEKGERYHRVERSYGSFTRGVRLPMALDGSRVLATFKNGVLTVTLPKTLAAKGTTIPIKTE